MESKKKLLGEKINEVGSEAISCDSEVNYYKLQTNNITY